MTALASSLIVKNKWSSAAVFAIVAFNPLMFSFSALTLNDLAISFYIVFAVLFFVRSFSKADNNISISIVNLLYSLLGVIVLTLIKPNLLVFVAMWVILVYTMLRYKLYKLNRKYKILLIAVLPPFLIYELCVDIPYVTSMWILRIRELADLFGKFLFISPAERFVGWFLAPWWNPAATTIFTQGFVGYLEYFYRILMPESLSLLISAVILALPIFILSRDRRKELDKTVLTSLVLLSLCLFYFEALSSTSVSDASRLSLWMIPLWTPLALTVLQDIKDNSSFRKLLPIFITALILLLVNIWLSWEKGGVYVGYALPWRLWTADVIIVQLMSFTVILSFLLLRADLLRARLAIGKRLYVVKKVNLKNAVFCLAIVLILMNGAYFSSQFMDKSVLYEDQGFTSINNVLDDLAIDGRLIFANNYIYMRPYVNERLFEEGLLLPPPDTKEEFFELLEVTPNDTLFLISDDSATTWYEYSNNYIKNHTYSSIIIPEMPNVSKIPKFNLTEPVLKMTFDDANETAIIDHSGFCNNGANHGAKPVEGYYGKALRFDGKEYISILGNVFNIQNEITISFLAKIEKAEPLKGYMMLSKGYASVNGSFDVFVKDEKIYFDLGIERQLSVSAEPYLGAWHHFIFTYDTEVMRIYVDGVLIATKPTTGTINPSHYDLEIGRDSERKAYPYIGMIDELQISNETLDINRLVETYYGTYATYARLVHQETKPYGQTSIFERVNSRDYGNSAELIVKNSRIIVSQNLTVTISAEVSSSKPQNLTVLLITDRFTKVHPLSLDSDHSSLEFRYNYLDDPLWRHAGGPFWLHLGQVRFVIIGEDGAIDYNKFISKLNLALINSFLTLLSGGVLLTYLVVSYKTKDKSEPKYGE